MSTSPTHVALCAALGRFVTLADGADD